MGVGGRREAPGGVVVVEVLGVVADVEGAEGGVGDAAAVEIGEGTGAFVCPERRAQRAANWVARVCHWGGGGRERGGAQGPAEGAIGATTGYVPPDLVPLRWSSPWSSPRRARASG